MHTDSLLLIYDGLTTLLGVARRYLDSWTKGPRWDLIQV